MSQVRVFAKYTKTLKKKYALEASRPPASRPPGLPVSRPPGLPASRPPSLPASRPPGRERKAREESALKS